MNIFELVRLLYQVLQTIKSKPNVHEVSSLTFDLTTQSLGTLLFDSVDAIN